MKKRKVLISVCSLIAAATLSLGVLSGCSKEAVGVKSIEKASSVGLVDYYTITYTDGTTSQFTVTNGKDGENAQSLTVAELFEAYKTYYGDGISYEEFCKKFISGSTGNTAALNSLLRSTLKVYTAFTERKIVYGPGGLRYQDVPALNGGSAVVYKMDDEYTYILTNYHVVYNSNSVSDKISTEISAYLYGSESKPTLNDEETGYNYDEYAISCEYIGGSVSYDVAVIRAKTEDVLAINPQTVPVTVNYDYSVGDNTYAVGNPDDGGMSVTEGIVSVESENIVLNIDGTYREYRSIRTDTAITHGNSGGGLFNMNGELIGLNNAGDSEITSMNYAIPAKVLTGVADGVIHYSNLEGAKTTKRALLNIQTEAKNTRYVFDTVTGAGEICEEVNISLVNDGGIAASLSLAVGDTITDITLNGVKTDVTREYMITDLMLNARVGDKVKVGYKRGGEQLETAEFTVRESDMLSVD